MTDLLRLLNIAEVTKTVRLVYAQGEAAHEGL
jgi:hypothetical protein